MTKTYYLFRHGLTQAVKYRTWYWHTIYSAPILEEGIPAIQRMASYLEDKEVGRLYSSPFLRCCQTAQIVGKAIKTQCITDSRIGEYMFEFPKNFRGRIQNFVSDLQESPEENIAICSHSMTIEMLLHLLTGRPFHPFRGMNAPAPGVLLVITGDTITEVDCRS